MIDEEEREENELIHFYQDKVLKLEAVIEKLKDCQNCDHSENNFCSQRKIFLSNNIANGCKDWEVSE